MAWMQTVLAKVIGIGVLALLMLVPLAQVQGLVSERQQLRRAAVVQIARGWGGEQAMGGLVLAVPTQRQVTTPGQGTEHVTGADMVLADAVTADVAMRVETRRYGIYSAPVFVADVKIAGHFLREDIARARAGSRGPWQAGKAELRLPLGDLRGLQAVDDLRIGGMPARLQSSAKHVGDYPAVVVPIDLDALPTGDSLAFSMTLRLAGTQSLQFLPLARRTDVRLSAPWPDPSFVGAALPLEHTVDVRGLTAHWRMLDLNRSFGQFWNEGAVCAGAIRASAFGVQLYQPVDVYQRNVRTQKYGLLFIAMTFVAFFLFEVLRKMRVHPVQYLLIGAALATFYLVLLALSEQIAFGAAYAIAAMSVVLMVGGYAASVLRARRAGVLLGGVMALVYAVLYGLVAAEQYALLAGSILLLIVVALLMYLTRRIDWYAYGPSAGQEAAAIMQQP